MTEQTPAAVDDELVESEAASGDVEEAGVPVPDGSDEQPDAGGEL